MSTIRPLIILPFLILLSPPASSQPSWQDGTPRINAYQSRIELEINLDNNCIVYVVVYSETTVSNVSPATIVNLAVTPLPYGNIIQNHVYQYTNVGVTETLVFEGLPATSGIGANQEYSIIIVAQDVSAPTSFSRVEYRNTRTPAAQLCDIDIDFSYTVDEATRTVTFTPSVGTYKYLWSFGDGMVSGETYPAHQYDRPGKYQVCLRAYDPGTDCSREVCKTILVGVPECVADFSFYVDEDDNFLYHFKDNSFGTVSAWYWNIADDTIYVGQDADHRFERPGTYQVCLSTFDAATSCVSRICKDITVGVMQLQADFTYYPDANTQRVRFTDNSFGDVADWYWTFGDGEFYSGKDTAHVYKKPGIYEVCLTVVDQTGRVRQDCQKVVVGTPPCNLNARFNYFVQPLLRNLALIDNSSGRIHSWFWDFGDGNSSSAPNPKHQYEEPGFYQVSLAIRDTIAKCHDFHSEVIQVGKAKCKAVFRPLVDPSTLTVKLQDQSIGRIKKYFWTFDDGSTSTDPQPVHQYGRPGLYEITLTVQDSSMTCMDRTSMEVQVGRTACSADFTVFIDSLTNTAYFNARAIGDSVRYYWIFSDGLVSRKKNPVRRFRAPGYHTVSLSVFNPLAQCMDSREKSILIGRQDIDCEADFIYRADEGNHTVVFKDESLGEDLNYLWNFGDGTKADTENAIHQYQEGGIYNVCLTVYSATGIQNTTCKRVFAGPPAVRNCLARFLYAVDDANLAVEYTDQSYGIPDSWTWKFGDGGTSPLQNPTHVFDASGYYVSHLRILSQATGCRDDAFALINVNEPGQLKADFGYLHDSVIITKAESYPVDYVGLSLGDASKFKWSFGDGGYDSTTNTPTHVYTAPGTYEVCLTIWDDMTGEENTECEMIHVGPSTAVPSQYESGRIILRCFPNPSGARCTVLFDMSSGGPAEIALYSVTGAKIRTLVSETLTGGRHAYELDTSTLQDGVYLVRLRTGSGTATRMIGIQH